MPVEVEEVVVVGERIKRVDPSPGIGNDAVFSVWTGSSWTEFTPYDPLQLNNLFDGPPPPSPIPDKPAVRVDETISKSDPAYPRLLAAAVAIQKQVEALHSQILSVGDNETISFARNNAISGAQLKQLWGEIDYKVTKQEYVSSTGRGGSVAYNAALGKNESRVGLDTIEGYQAQGGGPGGEYGVNYYLLHEFSHTTAFQAQYNQTQFPPTLNECPAIRQG